MPESGFEIFEPAHAQEAITEDQERPSIADDGDCPYIGTQMRALGFIR